MQETQRYSPDPTLSPVQHHVLSLLAHGVSTTEAASSAGVHRNTVATWRRTGPAFAREPHSKVIAMASDPKPGPMKPFPASAAQAEACIGQSLLLQTLVNESAAQESETMHNSAQPPTGIDENVEKPAQNCTSRPGRNAPCPCKSGLKYKRCCANRPSPN